MQTQRNAKGSPTRATTTTAASGEPEDVNLAPTKVDSFAKGSPIRATTTTAASGGNREELLGRTPQSPAATAPTSRGALGIS